MIRAVWMSGTAWLTRARLPVIFLLAVSWLLCLAIAATEPVDRDEHMYLAAASFVGEARLYEDVAFFQPPYAAWVYAGWDALTPGEWVLLPARMLKVLLAAGMVLALFALLRRLGADNLLAAILILLLVHTSPVRGVVGLARNYDLAQLAILGSLLLMPLRPGDDDGRWRLIIAGVLAGLAVGFKLTYLAPALVVVAWPLIAPTTLAAGRRETWWTAAGCLLGLAPLFILIAVTDPAALRFNLVDYHLLNADWQAQNGLGRWLGSDLRRLYRYGDLAGLTVLAVVAAILVIVRGRDWSVTVWRLALWLVAAGVAMLVIPRPVQTAYFVPLLLAAAMLVATAAVRLEGYHRTMLAALAGFSCLVGVIHHGGDDLRRLGGLGQVAIWPAVRLHDAGRTVADLTARHPDRPVVSTHPLYVLESGRPLSAHFAAGEFGWRLGDVLDRETQERFHLVTAQTFEDLMAREPASALVVEAVAPWDAPITGWAREAGWGPAPVAGGVLAWLPPRGPVPAGSP